VVFKLVLLGFYLVLFLGLPALVLQRGFKAKGWIQNGSIAQLTLFGLGFHLPSLILYRLAATPLGLPVWPYFVLPLGFLVWAFLETKAGHWAPKAELKAWGLSLLNAQTFKRALFFGLGLVMIIAAVKTYSFQPIEDYYQDEHQRMSIAHFIKLAYPPPEFHVYAPDKSYRYYNFSELLVATISQFTGISVANLYFRFLLGFNWTLIWIGFWGMSHAKKNHSPGLTFLLFAFFFFIQGAGGQQKIWHFNFHQNSFALACVLLSFFGLLRFYHHRQFNDYLWAIAVGSLAIGTKLVAFVPLAVAIPWIGLGAFLKGWISFRRFLVAGILAACLSGGWYFGVVRNYSPEAQPKLAYEYEPSLKNHWMLRESIRKMNLVPNQLFNYLVQASVHRFGDPLYWFWTPVFLNLEYVILLLAAVFLGRQKRAGPLGAVFWVLVLGCVASLEIFSLFMFDKSGGSLAYFLFFGSWGFCALAAYAFLQRFGGEDSRLGMGLVLILAFLSLNHYALTDSQNFQPLTNHWHHSTLEMQAFNTIKHQTNPQDWALHNYYRTNQIWSFASLAERRAIITSYYPGAVNQDPLYYGTIRPQADRFFNDQMSKEELASFLKHYPAKAVMALRKMGSGPDLSGLGFKKVMENNELVLWIKEEISPEG